MGKNGGRRGDRRARIDIQLEPKERQALKLTEIREALVAAGYDSTAKQAAVLGVCRSTAWVLLNRDKRAGPSARVIKRVLSSPQIPKRVRLKVEQYEAQGVSEANPKPMTGFLAKEETLRIRTERQSSAPCRLSGERAPYKTLLAQKQA